MDISHIKKSILSAIALLMALPFPAFAASVRIKSETMARFYERDNATEKDLLALPLYQYLSLAYDTPDQNGVSVNFAGWGRKNLGDDGVFADTETGELLYGYLDWRIKKISARIGRQTIFSGPASEAVDGGRIGLRLGEYEISGFAGLPVSLEGENGTSGDLVWGGKVAFAPFAAMYAAVSYKEVTSNGHRDSEESTGDLRWDLGRGIMFSGRSTYSIKSRGFSEHDFLLAIPLEENNIKAGFQRISYEDFFAATDKSASPFIYLKNSGDSLNVFRASATRTGETIEAGVSLRYYDHSNASRDAVYGGVTLSFHRDDLTQVGLETGRMESDDARNSFTLARIFTFIDRLPVELLPIFASADVVYTLYDEKINNEDYSLFIAIGGGARLFDDALEIKAGTDYSVDPYYANDLKSTVSVTWRWQKGGEEQ